MIGKYIRACVLLLSLWCWAYDFYLWGGLDATPQVGKPLMAEASVGSPLAATYMFVGRKLVAAMNWRKEAVDFAARHFPDVVADPSQLQYMPVQRVVAAQGFWDAFAYRMAPGGLVLSLVLHLLRQKQIRSFGTR